MQRKKTVKLVCIFPILMLVMLLCACCSSKSTKGVRANEISGSGYYAYSKNGNEAFIELKSNPTTGFDWYYDELPKGLELLDNSYESSNKDKKAAGGGGTRTFSFKVLEGGVHVIELTYKRNWEGGMNSTILLFSISASAGSDGLKIDSLQVSEKE